MTESELYQLKFPIGEFEAPQKMSALDIQLGIRIIERLPGQLKEAVIDLSENQLDTPYRPGGWTVRQVIHHLPDSHLNSYIRFKWTLTEDSPIIKAYQEADWANLSDYEITPIEVSLNLLKSLHQRWVILLNNLEQENFDKVFIHPETNKENRLDISIANYAWHSKHHLAHIVNLKKRMNWN
jgi:hypothetical protein